MQIIKNIQDTIRAHPTLGRIALHAIPDLPWNVNVRAIGPMTVNLRRNRSYWLRDPLIHERFMLGAMRRLIRPGDVVFDVGANIGLYVRFAMQVFDAGKVIAFEPMTVNRSLLTKNIGIGKIADRVKIVQVALSDEDGRAEFQVDDISSASGTLDVVTSGEAAEGRRRYGLPALRETVDVAQLDTLVETGRVPIPNMIKVDVEGAEARLLRGAVRTLDRHSPGLAIEHHGAEAARAVVQFLHSIHYHVFGVLLNSTNGVYKEIVSDDIDKVTDMYSLHHCVASRDAALLQCPISFEC